MYMRSLLLFALLALWLTPSTYAQASLSDSAARSQQATDVIEYYIEHIEGQSELFSGPRYELMAPANKGSYYFGDHAYCTPATVYFNSTRYNNVPILYDVYHDQMITYTGENFMVLDPTKAHDVNLLDHHFKYLEQPGLAAGYYDVLYNGKTQLLVKMRKVINEEIVSQREVQTIIAEKDQLYLKKGDAFFPVSGKSTVLSILSDKKKEIKQYLHDQKLDFNQDKTGAIVAIAAYYDQLNK